MKFTEILEELKKGKKATREEWEKCKTECYKYIKLEHGEIIAYLKDDNGEDKVEERTKCMFELADFTAEDWEIYQENPNQMWKPQADETYYLIEKSGIIFGTNNAEFDMDRRAIELGNCFKTKEKALHMLEKIKIINKLRELSNISFNDNCKQEKFVIFYNTENQQIRITQHTVIREIPFNIYFKNKEDCQKAIEIIGEDNLKKYYFDIAEVEEEK
jgi:hypothetical protein